MHQHSRRLWSVFLCILLLLSSILCSCGRERIAKLPDGEAGEFYSSKSQDSPETTAVQTQFDSFCTDVFREEMSASSTLDLHYTLLHPERYGIQQGEVTLGTYGITDMMENVEEIKSLKSRLEQFDRGALSDEQKPLRDALEETLSASLLSEGLELYEQPLAPTIGVQAQLPILLAEYSFHSLKDVEDYLSLLGQIDSYYGQILTFENQKAEAGLAPSDATIDGILKSCEGYLVDPEDNFLTETFELRLNALGKELSGTHTTKNPGGQTETSGLISRSSSSPGKTTDGQTETSGLTESQKADFRARHTAAIREHFVPAYEALISGMTALKGRGLRDGGLWELKDGRRYYEYLLKTGPGLSYTIPELKKALAARMESDLSALNQLFLDHPALDVHRGTFTLTDPGKILDDLKNQMRADFPEPGECRYEIRYVPDSLKDSLSPAFYLTAPLDDPDQNVIYINDGYSDRTDGLYTTLAHEGFPGHLYQTVYSRTHIRHPLSALLSCSGANEGWATYVENHACQFENGLPDGVGTYRALLRSFSLCVHGLLDIGINYEGWSHEQAKEFILTYFQVEDSTVDELWQVMIDNPTNYLEYGGGYVELMEMRETAETLLGPSFSPMEFHRFLLDLGPVPFSVTRRYFNDWLQTWRR